MDDDPLVRSVVCADLFTAIELGDEVDVNETQPSVARLRRAAWIFLNYFPEVASVTVGQALQIAIWDVIHDGGNGLGSGSVRRANGDYTTPQNVQNAVAAMLSASLGKSATNAIVYTDVRGATYKQTLLGAEVPEPATLALFGAGLMAIGLRKRRKKG